MMCLECGKKTKVLTTRSPSSPGTGWEVSSAGKAVDWYTSDFVVRRRECLSCGSKFFSAELSIEDIVAMMEHAAVGDAPSDIIKREGSEE